MKRPFNSAFTLIELLVVIAIISILAIVVILTLNPAQLLMQARDSNRFSDSASLQSAIGLLQTDQPGSSLGSSSTIYISIPDPTATSSAGTQCQGLGLPSAPFSWNYFCATSSTYRNVDGTGWIPVNLTKVSGGAPLAQLPTDPTNSTGSGLFYEYAAQNGQYDFVTGMEANKTKGIGGPLTGRSWNSYEVGSNITLIPAGLLEYKRDSSLIGYWSLDEGTSTTAFDFSINGTTGTWSGVKAGTSGYYSGGKVGPWSGYFNGIDDMVTIAPPSPLTPISNSYSVLFWFNANGLPADKVEVVKTSNPPIDGGPLWEFDITSSSQLWLYQNGTNYPTGVPFVTGNWNHIAYTFNKSNNAVAIYLNGSSVFTSTIPLVSGNYNNFYLGRGYFGYYKGSIDDVRLYNRVLSATEIQALYNGQK